MTGDWENRNGETQPLLRRESQLDAGEGGDSRELIQFEEHDHENPKEWKYSEKVANMGVIACMAVGGETPMLFRNEFTYTLISR